MSALARRLEQLFADGHAGPTPVLERDGRRRHEGPFKPAAVLIAFTDRPDPGLLLIHRPASMRAHPGQVAFPGGRQDEGEPPVEAALREAQEELGIDPALVQVIGATDLYLTGTGYAVTPVVGVVPADIAITPNPHEVASWFEAPADYVLDPARQLRREVEWQGAMQHYTEILWQGHRIWGVTAGIVRNLSRRLNWHG
ncbi:MAG TPA: CoA pyrophosphatase [Novosphingobium sp.]|nr:CoA pyrophosphatase [Novosphingobium sp.]